MRTAVLCWCLVGLLTLPAVGQNEAGPRVIHSVSAKELRAKKKDSRAAVLGIRRIRSRSGSVKEIVAWLAGQFQTRLTLDPRVDPARRVSIKGGRRRLEWCLNSIGLMDGGRRIEPIPEGYEVMSSSAFQLRFKRSYWKGEGDPGEVFEFRREVFPFVSGTGGLESFWWLKSARGKRNLSFESCKRHSPLRYLVRAGENETSRLIVQADLWWTVPFRFKFKSFEDGDVIRVGKFEVVLSWPMARIKLPMDVPQRALSNLLVFSGEPNDDPPKKKYPRIVSGRIRLRPGKVLWCGCRGSNQPGDAFGHQSKKMARKGAEQEVWNDRALKGIDRDDLKLFTVVLNVPVRERVKFTVNLKTSGR